MEIKTVLTELDIGTSNITIEGEVTYTMSPRNVTGDNEKGHYDFWSQFVVIEDATGKIGCGVNIEKEDYKLMKGMKARIKGKLTEYKDKKGEMVKKIDGKLIGISDRNKTTDVELEVAEQYFEEKAREEKKEKVKVVEKPIDKNNVFEVKDLRIARECAVKAVTELVAAKIMQSKKFFEFADTIVKYIYNGYDGNGKKKKSILQDDRQPLEIISEDAAFPDEVREEVEEAVNKKEKEEQGSSYDNPLPFKGKKKSLRKVSKAEDFLSADEMPS